MHWLDCAVVVTCFNVQSHAKIHVTYLLWPTFDLSSFETTPHFIKYEVKWYIKLEKVLVVSNTKLENYQKQALLCYLMGALYT